GCWGVYPYFPSGNIIASNINGTATGYGEMWVITPTYKRACYLEGKITDALSGNAINNATIEILGSSPLVQGTSKNTGIYKIGQVESGYYKVKISKAGYQSFESTVLFVAGEVVELSVGLYAGGNYTISGTVLNSLNNMPIQGAQINLYGQQTIANTTTDIDGAFSFSGVDNGIFDLVASHPDFGAATQQAQLITADQSVTMMLSNLFHRPEKNERDVLRLESGSFSAVNPFAGSSQLSYGHTKPDARFVVFNANGKVEEIHPLAAEGGSIIFGANLAPGIYFGRIENAEKQIEVIKLVKVQ
ncbi:MAG: carboxypeptidase regulatory-like domain-containing protein, partial [Saprospiraceae bacterium]|nr:carboxypeptidase regulatory-like domain-containing protein [Saprospiraceae bacterium]